MEMSELKKEIEKIVDENDKLRYTKQHNKEYADELREIHKFILNIAEILIKLYLKLTLYLQWYLKKDMVKRKK